MDAEKPDAARFESFKLSLNAGAPPGSASPALIALWHAAKGDWERAHEVAQTDESQNGSWVHAYLHRVEGDLSNAGYWYRRAGRDVPADSLEEEWANIASALS